ncbi:MAG TPA: nitrate- and nitrite sensing domain-containing protein [Kineosporiaceae bacterium]|nr:nitrate- and nitrite sensing domain-containing protein [Kineosporiaceae bacterium]
MLRAARRPRRSIRTRILVIAWVPGFVLLVAGGLATGVLALDGYREKSFAESTGRAGSGALGFLLDIQRERALSIQYLTNPDSNRSALDTQRKKTDVGLAGVAASSAAFQAEAPASFQPVIASMGKNLSSLPQLRKQVDARSLPVQQVFVGYTSALGAFQQTLIYLADNSAHTELSKMWQLASNLFRVAELRAQSEALTEAAYSPTGLTVQEFNEFVDLVGGYHTILSSTMRELSAAQQTEISTMLASSAWQQLRLVEGNVLETAAAPRGISAIHRARELPLSRSTWLAASTEISTKLAAAYLAQSERANAAAVDDAERELTRALFVGLGVLLLTALVFILVTRLSTGLIGRLRRLQNETLELADVQLPAMIDRLRSGEQVNVEAEMPPLDHGSDEIGQVAKAFNQAQQVAFSAAAKEAETRSGTEKVFLNIAHRNQLIAHHQLRVLDLAERSQEDPDQLDLLFQLDHLATRARRNAENLIILGGGQAGRRWRNPVSLLQLVRSAIGEAETYTRVSTGQVPAVSVTGAAVADLVHLLAELVDNATSFSPPSARVEVRGNVVGRGIVIEIEDQGLGIEPTQLAELNAMLQSSPDFGLMALAEEPRLGLFVVTQLAMRHGIRVTLTDSPSYGGTRAVVLIPTALISATGLEAPSSVPARLEQLEIMQGGAAVEDSQPRTRRANRVITLAPAEPPAPQYPTELPPADEQRVHTGSIGAHSLQETPQTAEIPQIRRAPSTPVAPAPAPQQPYQGFAEAAQAVQAAAQSHKPAPHHAHKPPGSVPRRDERPNLPRRTRQTHLAPQLQTEMPVADEPQTPPPDLPSAEHARDRLAAFQRGTRQGRETPPGPAM